MKLPIIFIASALLCSTGCRKIVNHVNQVVLHCGNSTPTGPTRYVQVRGPQGEAMEGSALEAFSMGSELRPLVITSKGCVLQLQTESTPILIRTTDDRTLAYLGSVSTELPLTQIQLEDVRNHKVSLDCPEPLYADSGRIDLKSFVKGSYNPLGLVLEQETDPSAPINGISFDGKGWPLDLPRAIHGSHELRLRAKYLLQPNHDEVFKNCRINLDLQVPVVMATLDQNFHLTQGTQVATKGPGETLNFKVLDDGFPSTVFYCLKKITEERDESTCDISEFSSSFTVLSAPQEGLWDLHYYAIDRAGHRSEMEKSRFLVYHAADIVQIKSLVALGQSEYARGNELKGIAYLLQAEYQRRLLSKWEAEPLRFNVLQGFFGALSSVSEKANFKPAIPLGVQLLTYSADGKHLAIVGNSRQIQIYDSQGNFERSFGDLGPNGAGELGSARAENIIWVNTFVDTQIFDFEGTHHCVLAGSVKALNGHETIYFVDEKSDETSSIYDKNCQKIGTAPSRSEQVEVVLAPNLKFHATLDSQSEELTLVNRENGEQRKIKFPGDPNSGRGPSFSPDGNWLAVAAKDHINFLSTKNPKLDFSISRISLAQTNFISEFYFESDQRIVISGPQNKFTIYNLTKKTTEIRRERVPLKWAIDSLGNYFYEVKNVAEGQVSLTVTPLKNESESDFIDIGLVVFPSEAVDAFSVNPSDPAEFAYAAYQQNISIRKFKAPLLAKIPNSSAYAKAQPSPDHKFYLTAGSQGLDLWNLDHALVTHFTPPEDRRSPCGQAIDPTFTYVAAVFAKHIDIFFRDGRHRFTVALPNGPVRFCPLTFAPDGQTLWAEISENKVVVINMRDGSSIVQIFPDRYMTLNVLNNDEYLISAQDFEANGRAVCDTKRLNKAGEILEVYEDLCVYGTRIVDPLRHSLVGFNFKKEIVLLDLNDHSRKVIGSAEFDVSAVDFSADFQSVFASDQWDKGILERYDFSGSKKPISLDFGGGSFFPMWEDTGFFWILPAGKVSARYYDPNGNLLLKIGEGIRNIMVGGQGDFAIATYDGQKDARIYPLKMDLLLPLPCRWSQAFLEQNKEEFPELANFCQEALQR